MQILHKIQTDVTPLHPEARLIQKIILELINCGVIQIPHIKLELIRTGIVLTYPELKVLMDSMERQGMIKTGKKEDFEQNGKPEMKAIKNEN